MNRLDRHLKAKKERGEKAAIFFITAGDPTLEETLDIMRAMAENGADCIELGMPFSDPIADGPVIQRSTARALEHNVKLDDIFQLVRSFRLHSETPVVLMGYYNPIMRFGLERAVKDCRDFGVDGLIVADLPYEEGLQFERLTKKQKISFIYLLAPDIDPKRTQNIVRASRGFVYCVAQYSTTGVEGQSDSVLPETIESIKQMSNLPVALGFGISSIEKAKTMSQYADGIIIGSWLIKELETSQAKAETAGKFVKAVKSAISEK